MGGKGKVFHGLSFGFFFFKKKIKNKKLKKVPRRTRVGRGSDPRPPYRRARESIIYSNGHYRLNFTGRFIFFFRPPFESGRIFKLFFFYLT
jgi:hypothetical protein